MPILPPIDPDITTLPMEYSISAIRRNFVELNQFMYQGVVYDIIFDAKVPLAAVVEVMPTERKGGRLVRRIVTMLWLEKTTNPCHVNVKRFWEDDSVIRSGLAKCLCETVVEKTGLTLLADRDQYLIEQSFWYWLARKSDVLNIFLLDKKEGSFYRFDGIKIRYDETNIPESEIWSTPPDTKMERIVLVAEAKGKR